MLSIIRIPDKSIKMCDIFAGNIYETNADYYKTRRNQPDPDICKKQISDGKKAELAVYQFLKNKEINDLVFPDFYQYAANKKSFSGDTAFKKNENEYFCHVKTQTIDNGTKFGVSWIFQKEDPLTKSPRGSDIIALTRIQDVFVQILSLISAQKLVGIYSEPKKKILDSKMALYHTDVVNAGLDNICDI